MLPAGILVIQFSLIMSKILQLTEVVYQRVIENLKDVLDVAPEALHESGGDDPTRACDFLALHSDVQCRILAHDEQSVALTFNVRLGRVLVGYERALRWLANNRACNSLALASFEHSWQSRDLWVNCNRITLPKDHAGIKLTLIDVLSETLRATTGLKLWFPHLIAGTVLKTIESEETPEDQLSLNQRILDDPGDYLQWAIAHPSEALQLNGLSNARIFGWMKRWEDSLAWLELCDVQTPAAEKSEAWHEVYRDIHCTALCETKRYDELLESAKQLRLDDESEEANEERILLRCRALLGLKRYQEMLRLVQSSFYDDCLNIWFYRMMAHAQLGATRKSIECLEAHESTVGPDFLAKKWLRNTLDEAFQE